MQKQISTAGQVLIAVLVLFTAQDGSLKRDSVYLFAPAPRAAWQAAMADWQSRSDMAVQNDGRPGASFGGAAAQSFVPRRQTIEAVQLRISLGMVPRGWVRVELTDDKEGLPGRVLARSWVRLGDRIPILSSEYLTVPIRAKLADPGATYWITMVECRDRGFKHTYLANLLGSSEDSYPEGRLLLPDGRASAAVADAHFRIAATAPAVPGLEDVSELMHNAIPHGACRTASWRTAFEECNRTGPGASAQLPSLR